MAEWLAGGRAPAEAATGPNAPTVAVRLSSPSGGTPRQHYRHRNGTPTGEIDNYRDSLRPLRRLHGSTLAADFGPLKLKAVRQSMIDSGLARTTINQRIGRIDHVFKWASSEELIPASVHQALKTVSGLPRGDRLHGRPNPWPVSDADVDAVRPFVPRQVWALIELQRLTGRDRRGLHDADWRLRPIGERLVLYPSKSQDERSGPGSADLPWSPCSSPLAIVALGEPR